MKLIIHGATGRMGKVLIEKINADPNLEYVAGIDPMFPEENDHEFKTIEACDVEADAVIDFSHHSATKALMDYCVDRMLPVVVCTTAHTPEEKEMLQEAAKDIPVFFSANMSIGIALLTDLAKRAAAAFPNANIEIVEKHHNQKLDVPSGTALMLANAIKSVRTEAEFNVGRHENGKRTDREIGIHSLRLGTEVGTHEIIIATGTETITLKHEAENRSLFADGALAAATYISAKDPGMYDMLTMIA